MKFEMRGFDELQRKLEDLQRRAERLHGEQQVSFAKIFSPEFMRRYTKHPSIEAMFAASPWTVNRQEDLAAIPNDPWDQFVRQETQFRSWKEMKETAAAEYLKGELGLK